MPAALRALADESRRTMLETMARGPCTVSELAALLPIARPGVSRHLRVLREAGLVEARQDAQRRIYSLRPQPLAEIDEWLGRYRALWEQRLDALHTEIARGKHERRRITGRAVQARAPASWAACEQQTAAASCGSKTAMTLISTTCGQHSPIRAAWPAGTAGSTATCVPADSSACTSSPPILTLPAASKRVSPRGGCW